MAIGIIYDNNNKVIETNLNADSLEWGARPNSLVFHDGNSTEDTRNTITALIKNTPIKYLKKVGNDIFEMTHEEKDAQDAADLAAVTAELEKEMRMNSQILADAKTAELAILRAMLIEILNYVNQERTNFNSLLTWLGAQGGLTNRAQLTNGVLSIATASQAFTAIKARLANGEADKIQ